MDRKTFEQVVADTVASLPARLRQQIHNVAIVVEEFPDDEVMDMADGDDRYGLLGFYEGVPLTARTQHYGMVTPDVIHIFQKPIEAVCADERQVRDQVRQTVLHEIAHYFGIDDDRLDELGI